jgi:hypothetical protein
MVQRSIWSENKSGALAKLSTSLGIGFGQFQSGSRVFEVLFTSDTYHTPTNMFWADGRLVFRTAKNGVDITKIFTPSSQGWAQSSLTEMSDGGRFDVKVTRLDCSEDVSDGMVLVTIQDGSNTEYLQAMVNLHDLNYTSL